MNEFTEFRNHIYDSESPYIYPLLFLDNYINKNKTINSKESLLIKRIKTIKQIEHKNILCEKDVDDLCSFLGDNLYIDRFIVDTILKFFASNTKKLLEEKIKVLISEKAYNSQKLYHILDICIECGIDVLGDSDLSFMLQKYKWDLDIFSVLMDYMDNFKRDGFKDDLYKLLMLAYPDNIKAQIVNLLVNLYSIENIDMAYFKKI